MTAEDLIRKHEGLKLTAYKCPAGVWTIGYGHTGTAVREGLSISRQQAEQWLAEDVATARLAVEAAVSPAKLTKNQLEALTSFTYNVGEGAFKRSTMLRLIKADPTDQQIRAEFARWVLAGGKRLPGLVTRRAEEAALYFSK
jgi:lysozyme